MKKILITGANSYIGTSLEKWLRKYPDKYSIETVDMRNDTWKKKDFSKFNVVFHVAGIAHIRETRKNKDLYYKINCDLSYAAAKKAKDEGVKQFIFLSSMSVYGIESGVIDKDTSLKPDSNYGKSKLQAEVLITSLEDDVYKVVILRPPMIYGKGCKGNYRRLANLAVRTPIFPDINNKRSMIYIDNLCEFIRLMIDNKENGIFFPQNAKYVKTAEMVRLIAEAHGKKIRLTRVFNPALRVIGNFTCVVNKAFGNLVYKSSLSTYKEDYRIRDMEQSILATESTTKDR